LGEFSECRGTAQGGRGIESQFVMPATEVLDEGMSGDDDRGRSVGS
jgi:hypothetical protein